MARGVGVISLDAVTITTDGTAVRSGRRAYLSWAYEPTGTVTGGVSVQSWIRLLDGIGIWYPLGDSYTNIAGHYTFGSTPTLVYEAKLVQTGIISGGGSITGRILFA